MSAIAPMAASVDAAASERTDWIDAAKGMGIVLVVLGHAIGGLHDARLMADDDAWQTVFYVIYTFHMPLFFFLSGLFVEKRVRAQPARFAESLFTRIAWPYFLWCTFQLMVISLLGTLVNVPSSFDLWRCVELVWKPASQFWYLHALFVMHAASLLVVPRYGTKGLLVLALFVMALPALVPLGSLKECAGTRCTTRSVSSAVRRFRAVRSLIARTLSPVQWLHCCASRVQCWRTMRVNDIRPLRRCLPRWPVRWLS